MENVFHIIQYMGLMRNGTHGKFQLGRAQFGKARH